MDYTNFAIEALIEDLENKGFKKSVIKKMKFKKTMVDNLINYQNLSNYNNFINSVLTFDIFNPDNFTIKGLHQYADLICSPFC